MRQLFLILVLFISVKLFSETICLFNDSTYKKVCADLRSRKLLYNCVSRYKPHEFVFTCSRIKNDSVQKAYKKYLIADDKKNKFRSAAIVSVSIGGACILGSSFYIINTFGDKSVVNVGPIVLVGGIICVISLPFSILATIHNVKKKKILYKELPNAYNFYVNKQ